MKKTNGDHMKMHQDCETGAHQCECWHCGATQGIALPMPMDAFARLLKRFAAEHRDCPAPKHIEIVAPDIIICHHCDREMHAINRARLDVPAVVATHLCCPAPAPAALALEAHKCPICSRVLDLSSRISGDVIRCSCNTNLHVTFYEGGVRLSFSDVFTGRGWPRRVRKGGKKR